MVISKLWQLSIEEQDLLMIFLHLIIDRDRIQSACLAVLDSNTLLINTGFLRFRDTDQLFQHNHRCSQLRAHMSSTKPALVP